MLSLSNLSKGEHCVFRRAKLRPTPPYSALLRPHPLCQNTPRGGSGTVFPAVRRVSRAARKSRENRKKGSAVAFGPENAAERGGKALRTQRTAFSNPFSAVERAFSNHEGLFDIGGGVWYNVRVSEPWSSGSRRVRLGRAAREGGS